MAEITVTQIRAWLTEVGNRYPQPATLLLLGGSALCLLGSPRATMDIDYVGHDLHKNALQAVIEQVAQEMHLEVEAVVNTAVVQAQAFNLNAAVIHDHLQAVRNQL